MSSTPALKVHFARLAKEDKDFAKYYDRRNDSLDWNDPDAIRERQLAKSTLKHYYSIDINLPNDRLCPTIPMRRQYIEFVKNLVYSTGPPFTNDYNPERPVIGLDIGIGASCIYPLLGCALFENWRFIGTDIDIHNLESAINNVRLNNLQERILLYRVNPGESLLPLRKFGADRSYDFVMCNPPFYTSVHDMYTSAAEKSQAPNAVCTGADFEMVTEGGEVGFVRRILEASLVHKDRVQWFTSMLGKLSSVGTIVRDLQEHNINNFAVNELVVGEHTKRWVVAWSFQDLRTTNDLGRGLITAKGITNPWPTEMFAPLNGGDADVAGKLVNAALTELDVSWFWSPADLFGFCYVKENCWSRKARRRRQALEASGALEAEMEVDKEVKLVVKITVEEEPAWVRLRWVKGIEQVLFESFGGMVQKLFQ